MKNKAYVTSLLTIVALAVTGISAFSAGKDRKVRPEANADASPKNPENEQQDNGQQGQKDDRQQGQKDDGQQGQQGQKDSKRQVK